MFKFLTTVFIILATSIISIVWLNSNSGEAVFVVMDTKLETTFTAFALTSLLVILAIQIIIVLLYKMYLIPQNIRSYYYENKLKKQIFSLSKFITSIAGEEYKAANSHLKSLDQQILDPDDLEVCGLMLDKFACKNADFRSSLLSLSNQDHTKKAALYELIRYSLLNKEFAVVAKYCKDLWQKIKNKNIAKLFFKSLVLDKNWTELDKQLDKSRFSLTFSESFASYLSMQEHYNLICYTKYMRALQLEAEKGSPSRITSLLEEARSFVNDQSFVNYELTRQYFINKKFKKALNLLIESWQQKPLALMHELALEIAKEVAKGDFEKGHGIILQIIGNKAKSCDDHLLLAASALESDLFKRAQEHISEALDCASNQRAYILMAEYCERSHGNKSESIQWLRKAYNCKPDNDADHYYFDFQNFTFTDSPTADCVKLQT